MAAVLVQAVAAFSQTPRGLAHVVVGGSSIAVEYGRPDLNGRDMLDEHAPPGTVWRLGADQATVLRTEAALVVGDVTLPPGAYSLFAHRVDDESWELIFNVETGQWGTNRQPTLDYAAVALVWEEAYLDEETFTIELEPMEEGVEIRLKWGLDVMKATFSVELAQ